jgi:hypothetical protein
MVDRPPPALAHRLPTVTIMRLRDFCVLGPLAVGLVQCSCSAGPATSVKPLPGAMPITVSLQGATNVPSGDLPRFEVSGLAGTVEVVWDVESGPCLIAEASDAQAGTVIEVRLHRSGSPAATARPASSCIAMPRGPWHWRPAVTRFTSSTPSSASPPVRWAAGQWSLRLPPGTDTVPRPISRIVVSFLPRVSNRRERQAYRRVFPGRTRSTAPESGACRSPSASMPTCWPSSARPARDINPA